MWNRRCEQAGLAGVSDDSSKWLPERQIDRAKMFKTTRFMGGVLIAVAIWALIGVAFMLVPEMSGLLALVLIAGGLLATKRVL